jgi:hypothetical protein
MWAEERVERAWHGGRDVRLVDNNGQVIAVAHGVHDGDFEELRMADFLIRTIMGGYNPRLIGNVRLHLLVWCTFRRAHDDLEALLPLPSLEKLAYYLDNLAHRRGLTFFDVQLIGALLGAYSVEAVINDEDRGFEIGQPLILGPKLQL